MRIKITQVGKWIISALEYQSERLWVCVLPGSFSFSQIIFSKSWFFSSLCTTHQSLTPLHSISVSWQRVPQFPFCYTWNSKSKFNPQHKMHQTSPQFIFANSGPYITFQSILLESSPTVYMGLIWELFFNNNNVRSTFTMIFGHAHSQTEIMWTSGRHNQRFSRIFHYLWGEGSGSRCEFTACQEVVCHQVYKSIATLSPFLQHKKILVQAGVQLNVEILFILFSG